MDILGTLIKQAEKCKSDNKDIVNSTKKNVNSTKKNKKKNVKSKKDPNIYINKALNKWKNKNSSENLEQTKITVANLLVDGLFVRAEVNFDSECIDLLSQYVAFLRALYLIYQQNHWETPAYSQHLLFQRLYEKVQENADQAAERVIGLTGKLMHKGLEGRIAQKFTSKEKNLGSILKSSIDVENKFHSFNNYLYKFLKEKKVITLGLDDLIMSHSSDSEERLYLLKQSLKD